MFNDPGIIYAITPWSYFWAEPKHGGIHCMFDDPGIICAITPWSYFWTEHKHGGNRWHFFHNGKVLPILESADVTQPAHPF
eukprot:gene25590-11243_t